MTTPGWRVVQSVSTLLEDVIEMQSLSANGSASEQGSGVFCAVDCYGWAGRCQSRGTYVS